MPAPREALEEAMAVGPVGTEWGGNQASLSLTKDLASMWLKPFTCTLRSAAVSRRDAHLLLAPVTGSDTSRCVT